MSILRKVAHPGDGHDDDGIFVMVAPIFDRYVKMTFDYDCCTGARASKPLERNGSIARNTQTKSCYMYASEQCLIMRDDNFPI